MKRDGAGTPEVSDRMCSLWALWCYGHGSWSGERLAEFRLPADLRYSSSLQSGGANIRAAWDEETIKPRAALGKWKLAVTELSKSLT